MPMTQMNESRKLPDHTAKQKAQFRPSWIQKCDNCGQSPIVPVTNLCGPCTFGEADTVMGGWWDDKTDTMK